MTQIWEVPVSLICLKDKPPFCWEVYKHDAPKRLRVKLFLSTLHPHPSTSTPIRFQSLDQAGSPNLTRWEGWLFLVGMKCLLSCQRVFLGTDIKCSAKKKASEDSSKWTSTKRLRVLVSKMFYFYHDPSGKDFQSDSYAARAAPTPRVLVPGKGVMIETAVQPHRDPPIFFPPIPMRNTE